MANPFLDDFMVSASSIGFTSSLLCKEPNKTLVPRFELTEVHIPEEVNSWRIFIRVMEFRLELKKTSYLLRFGWIWECQWVRSICELVKCCFRKIVKIFWFQVVDRKIHIRWHIVGSWWSRVFRKFCSYWAIRDVMLIGFPIFAVGYHEYRLV